MSQAVAALPDARPATPVRAPEPPPAEPPRGFGHAYWMLNTIEMFERLAYYGIRTVVPIYIMQATEPGGLHLTAAHKGIIYAWWAVIQSWLPIVTGGFADRYGFKRTLAFAISLNTVGYLMMAAFHNYVGFFAGILVLAFGTAFFKPSLQGALAHHVSARNSSVGWGIFYWVVNIGAFIAPILSTVILGKPHSAEGWRNLFLACAGYTAFNLLLLFTFRDPPSGASKTDNPFDVLIKAIVNIANVRLIVWLLIMSCFWMMMYQLWDLHPNFIEDWVDSSMIAPHMPLDGWREYGDRGLIRVPQQILLNLNAALIILLILPVSWLVRRMRTLSAMLIGMFVATTGIVVAGMTGNAVFLLVGIVFFSLGEMLTGPKKNQYLGLIAPKGKKGLYLGYVNIPVGIGVGIGSWIAGHVYDNFGEKATLALKELSARPQLVAHAARSADWSDALEKIPPLLGIERGEAFSFATEHLGGDPAVAAEDLRRLYRHDAGQITNLALQYLAQRPEFATQIASLPPAEAAPDTAEAKDAPTTAEAERDHSRSYAEVVDKLPGALGVKRIEALERVRHILNTGAAPDQAKTLSAVIDLLWERFGDDPATLNNLALEYLAQGTDRVQTVVAAAEWTGDIKQLEERLGLGRTKSFAALSQALAAENAADAAVLAPAAPEDQVIVELMARPHVRFLAVARRDWKADTDLLRELVEPDDAARAAAAAKGGAARGDEAPAVDFDRLAEKQDRVQTVLAARDWSRSAELAARVLGLSPFEARATAAVERTNSAQIATQLLWEKYNPQYFVWLPFAGIGVVATIALWLFGLRARRWTDMNA